MTNKTLAVLLTAECPVVLTETVFAVVDRAMSALGCCDYEVPETSTGAADAICCTDHATVLDLFTGFEYCAAHFRAVCRG